MTTSESPVERRKRETIERCTTPVQRATCERLHAEGKTAYPERRQGKTVVAEFRRYCETRDPEKIGPGLYHFSIMGAGGLDDIAHYDIHGFRHEYPHPAVYIERLLMPETNRWYFDPREEPNGFHSQHVYTDGMTAGEVCRDILAIADAQREQIARSGLAKIQEEKLAKAERLAEDLGMRLVPR